MGEGDSMEELLRVRWGVESWTLFGRRSSCRCPLDHTIVPSKRKPLHKPRSQKTMELPTLLSVERVKRRPSYRGFGMGVGVGRRYGFGSLPVGKLRVKR